MPLILKKKGKVSKQHLINQMADYLTQNDVNGEASYKISILNQYPDIIDYENFKLIYLDLTKSNISYQEEDEEDEEVLICSMYEEIIKGSGSDSDISDNEIWSSQDYEGSKIPTQGSVIDISQLRQSNIGSSIPTARDRVSKYYAYMASARRRTTDTVVSTRTGGGPDDSRDDLDEVSYMTDSGMSLAAEEVDKLAESYKSVVSELNDLKFKLEASTEKYVNQREMAKVHSDRIMLLEEQIRQLENVQHEQIEQNRKEIQSSKNHKRQRKEMDTERQIQNDGIFREEVLARLNTLESEYNASNAEYERMKQECSVLLKEKEYLEKELNTSDKRGHDLEITLQNYKHSVSLQMADLQRERDNAEEINKKLYYKLQDTRLSYKCKESNHTEESNSTDHSPVQNRQQSWAGPFNFIGSSRSGSKHSIESGSELSSTPSCTTISQLERVVHCLTMDNRNLVEKVSHLETLEFYQRQRINVSNNMSLAHEMDQLNVADLKNALTTEREIAKRLQLYIMGLTNRLMLAGYIEAFRHN